MSDPVTERLAAEERRRLKSTAQMLAMTDQDPLAGADVGETARVTTDMEHWVHEYHLGEMDGTDRTITDLEVDAETYTDERGEARVRFTFDGEVMKTLPRRWDYCREPRTAEEEKAKRRRAWVGRGLAAAVILLPLVAVTWATTQVMARVDGALTINGEAMTAPTFAGLIPVVVTVFALGVLVFYGLYHGGPTDMVGGRR